MNIQTAEEIKNLNKEICTLNNKLDTIEFDLNLIMLLFLIFK